ncbi:hypothetical protein [Pigmentiphaga sp. CHJ604]|uniref:hypothetical protein n=1 Tax=Pigmentiphaga sp. CHJ604 TaxID=3081984 RepID=UPI0030D24F8C
MDKKTDAFQKVTGSGDLPEDLSFLARVAAGNRLVPRARFESYLSTVVPLEVPEAALTLDVNHAGKIVRMTNPERAIVMLPATGLPPGFQTMIFGEGAEGFMVDASDVTLLGNTPYLVAAQNIAMLLIQASEGAWIVLGGVQP